MVSAGVVAAAAGLWSGGCNQGLSDIDLRAQKLLDQRSAEIGGGAVSPGRTPPPSDVPSDGRMTAKNIPTVNPDASELRYKPAQDTRDVTARLQAYARRAQMPVEGQKPFLLDLNTSLKVGQKTASEYLTAEEDYILVAIRVLIERHLWGPRLFNDTTVSVAGKGDQGNFQSALTVMNDLRVTQRLPYGGQVEAGWVWQATDQLRQQATERYQQTSELVLSGSVPLLRGAGLIAQEDLIQAERSLVYAARNFEAFRRDFLLNIARDYFDLLLTKAQIRNQEAQVLALEEIERGEIARFEAGRIAAFKKNIASNDVLGAKQQLASEQESFILKLERFKIRLGLPSEQVVELSEAVLDIPEPQVSLDEAVARAMDYRLDLQNLRDQLDDARRAVKNARNQVLPNLDVTGRVGIPTDPRAREGGILFQPGFLDYQAGVTFGAPLDRTAERLSLRQATIALQQREREYERFRDETAVGVRQAVRNIDLARFQLRLAEERVTINRLRQEEIKLKAADVDTQTKVDAANALSNSESTRDSAVAALRTAILTYLRDTGQLRIARDGTFVPLPGMERAPAAEPAPPALPLPQPPPAGNG